MSKTNLTLGTVLREKNINKNYGRQCYWLYVILEECGIAKYFKDKDEEYLLNDYKLYMIVNYAKLFGIRVYDMNDISHNFKIYFQEFFEKTCTITSEETLRKEIDNEVRRTMEEHDILKRIITNTRESLRELHKKEVELENILQNFKILDKKILTEFRIGIGVIALLNIILLNFR